MALLTPLALLGFLLVPGLVALHLHRRRLKLVEVPSLIPWELLAGEPARSGKGLHVEQVLPLLLQLLALCAVVFSLARLASTSGVASPQVYVLDRGALMAATDPAPSRFEAARRQVERDIQGAAPGTTVTVVLADAQPRVLISTTDHARANQRLGAVSPVAANPDLGQAIRLGAGFVGRNGRLHILYARGETLPPISAPPGMVSITAIGASTDNQSIARFTVRCMVAAPTCGALATLRNDSGSPVPEDVVINADGVVLGRKLLQLPPGSDTDLSFAVPATRHVIEMYLTRRDLVPADNAAWAVPPTVGVTTATVVGDPAHTAPIVQALGALPKVRVTVLPPSRYGSIASGVPGLLILAGWMPSGGLPATPNLLLFDPPRFPGAPAPSVLNDTSISGEDAASPLLTGVDLTSLDLPQGSGEQLVLPAALQPVVWAAHASLITAGVLDGRHVVTVAFDPKVSNLSQLDAFPLLMNNVLRWSAGWLPTMALPGDRFILDVPPATSSISMSYNPSLNSPPIMLPVTRQGAQAFAAIPSPGVYTVTERGVWGVRDAQAAANVSSGGIANAGGPIQISPAGVLGQPAQSTVWWPVLGLIAAIAVALEWLVVVRSPRTRG
ncbi:MAG TPA: VWA domain-containing protein [Chloroflexota bacterium]|jgi:hypothetical protein